MPDSRLTTALRNEMIDEHVYSSSRTFINNFNKGWKANGVEKSAT